MHIANIKGRMLFIFLIVFILNGCDRMQMAPLIIDADGKQYIACKGIVWVNDDSGMLSSRPVYKISFSDLAGKNNTLRGVENLHVYQPHEKVAPMPYSLPDIQKNADMNGKPYIEGKIYSWDNGAKAKLVNGKWAPVKLSNACD